MLTLPIAPKKCWGQLVRVRDSIRESHSAIVAN